MVLPPDDCLYCLKGLRNEEAFFEGGFDYTVFQFQPMAELEGWEGSSVNWDLLGGNALNHLLNQPKNGELQFKAGAIRIPRSEIDKLIERYGSGNVGYELREENGNEYHGHILLLQSLQRRQKITISSILANAWVEHHKQPQQNA